MYEREHYKTDLVEEACWAVNTVIGVLPSRTTTRRWIYEGFNGVRLEARPGRTRKYKTQTTARLVIEFIYELNGRMPPFEIYQLDRYYLPRPIADVVSGKLGHDIDRRTLSRWCTRGLNGAKLEVLKVGSLRLTSMCELEKFLAAAGYQRM